MDHFAKLVTVLALCCAGAVHAGYAQLTPPPGWSAGTGAGATYQAATASEFERLIARPVATLAGSSAKVPVSLAVERTAASRMLAGRVGTALLAGAGGPLGVGLTVGAALLMPQVAEWWQSTDFEWDGLRWNRKINESADGWTYSGSNAVYLSKSAAASALVAESNVVGANERPPVRYSSPWIVDDIVYAQAEYYTQTPVYHTSVSMGALRKVERAPSVKKVPADYDTEVKPALEQLPLPEKLPNVVWPASWPVKDPVINPDSTGKPQPLFVPTGNPVRNPKFDPSQAISPTNQPYLQPGIRVVPSPAPGEPWRVDVQPVDKPVGSADPADNKDPDDPANDKPQDDPSLCEKHPDILACQKLDQPEDTDLPKSEKDISITPDGGWGAENAACPAPRHLTVQGRDIPIPFDLFCVYMQGLRPIIIAMAWLSAAFILIGARESS